jgi:hypothetical protein
MGLQKHKHILKNWYFFVVEWNSLHQVWKRNNWPKLSKRRKLFNVSTKTSACKNLLNMYSCLSNNVCRNYVDKNSNLLDLL